MVKLARQVRRLSPSLRPCLAHSGAGGSKGGFAEQAVQPFEGMPRAHKLSLGQRFGQNALGEHPVMGWLVEHSVESLNLFYSGSGGRAPHRAQVHKFVGDMLD